MMKRVAIGDGVEFSRIAYGTWRVGDDEDTSPSRIRAKIDACLNQGITTIDHADIYGGYTAEGLFGACLKESPGLRDKLEIVTKCGIRAPAGRHASARVKHYDTTAAHISGSVDTSLSEMATDRIDLLLVHRPDPFMDPEETGRALDNAVSSGKVRAVGASNFRPWDWTLLQSAMSTPLLTNQIEISLAKTTSLRNGDMAFLQERRICPMAWSPLGGGSLFADGGDLRTAISKVALRHGVEEAAVAVAWLLAHPAGILPVMGSNRIDRIRMFGDALKVEMDRETWFELYVSTLGAVVP